VVGYKDAIKVSPIAIAMAIPECSGIGSFEGKGIQEC